MFKQLILLSFDGYEVRESRGNDLGTYNIIDGSESGYCPTFADRRAVGATLNHQ